jgi:sec-independent protein translocase protein TatC
VTTTAEATRRRARRLPLRFPRRGGNGSEPRPDRDPEGRMTIMEHLTELRNRLMICLAAVAVAAVVCFVFADTIIGWMVDPYCDAIDADEIQADVDASQTGLQADGTVVGCRLLITEPLEGFTVRLKVAGYSGIVLASPILLWQVWRFISPGLAKNEKKYAVPFMLSAVSLFLFGAALAVYTMPRALEFLLEVGGDDFQPVLRAGSYLSFVSLMMVAFGISFQLPVVIMTLLLARITTTKTLARFRRYALVGIVVFAAVITPSQDPISLLAMAVPMYLLYEGCIILGRILKR